MIVKRHHWPPLGLEVNTWATFARLVVWLLMVALKLGPMPVNAAVNVSSMMVANFVVATKLGN